MKNLGDRLERWTMLYVFTCLLVMLVVASIIIFRSSSWQFAMIPLVLIPPALGVLYSWWTIDG